MAITHKDLQLTAHGNGRRAGHAESRAPSQKPASVLDLLVSDDPLREEMAQVLRDKPGTRQSVAANGNADTEAAAPLPLTEHEEVTVLRVENAQLRTRVAELEQIVEATTEQAHQIGAEQQKEFEALLEEKSEVIRTLYQQLQELREQPAPEANSAPPGHGGDASPDIATLQQELLVLKEELEERQRQLEADEAALMDQMRQMEIAMSRDRVEMARQRTELQRLHQDLQHDLEQAQRDGGLRERLQSLQRRAQPEAAATPRSIRAGQSLSPAAPPTTAPTGSNQTPPPARPAARRTLPTQAVLPANGDAKKERPSSGFLRRLFG